MRLRARQLLFRQIQEFFERHLADYWRISNVEFDEPVMAEKIIGRRQLAAEIVVGRFAGYTLSIFSTAERPPLGQIICSNDLGDEVRGVIDETTWGEIAGMIRKTQGKRIRENVYG